MYPQLKLLLDCTLAFIALINPISKIFAISTLSEKTNPRQIHQIAAKSSIVAILILISFALIGSFILRSLFHVDVYSFKIIGGFVLIYRGFLALDKGIFFEATKKQKLEDMSIVPLASPMIAGPAAITASISFPTKYGMGITLVAISIAIVLNLFLMYWGKSIGSRLIKYNLMGALIRIGGLIVATIGVQMMLDGFLDYINNYIKV